jgi:hypothetical protein
MSAITEIVIDGTSIDGRVIAPPAPGELERLLAMGSRNETPATRFS